MLALWMFGTELERMWGTPFFVRYYFATGIAAAFTTIVFSMAPMPITAKLFGLGTIGASGAIYGLLLAVRSDVSQPAAAAVPPVSCARQVRRDDLRRHRAVSVGQ
jgi:hypothetical protein